MSFDPEEYFDENVGIQRRAGHEQDRELVLSECPFCGDTHGHCYVNIHKRVFNCYKCGESGRLFRLLAEVEGTPESQVVARLMREGKHKATQPLVDLLNKAKLLSPRLDTGQTTKTTAETYSISLPDGYIPCVNKKTGAVNMPVYLRDRGVTPRMLAKFKVGYATSGFYSGCILWPISTAGSTTFVARSVAGLGRGPKYDNPKEAPMAHFMMNYDNIPRGVERIIPCEGPMDVMRLDDYGHYPLGLFGKGLSDYRVDLILSLQPKCLVFMLDSDALPTAIKMAQITSGLIPTKVAWLKSGDPDSSSKDTVAEAIANAQSIDSIQLLRWKSEYIDKYKGIKTQ